LLQLGPIWLHTFSFSPRQLRFRDQRPKSALRRRTIDKDDEDFRIDDDDYERDFDSGAFDKFFQESKRLFFVYKQHIH